MKKEELRKSVYRVFSDLIKQDNIITEKEVKCLEDVCKVYRIAENDKIGGHMMTLADAITTLQGESPDTRKDIYQRMKNCSLADNVCCRNEALLLTAFKYCCDESMKQRSYVRSFPKEKLYINESQMIYLENEEKKSTMSELMDDEEQYSDFRDICRLGGFNFVYIPKLAEHFRDFEDKETLKEIVSLVSPSLKSNEINSIIQVICGMSTTYFYRKVLRDKLQVPFRIIDKPVFLFCIGGSVVGGQDYINYLCVEIGESIKEQLRNLINCIMEKQSSYHLFLNKATNDKGAFEYDGFFRTLLDMMAIKKVSAPDIIIHTWGSEYKSDGKKVILSAIDADGEFPIEMDRREAAFYVLLLCACAKGGLGVEMNFIRDKHGDLVLKNHLHRRPQYRAIYSYLSSWINTPEIVKASLLRPARSYITKAIKSAKRLSPQALYIPIERNGYLMLSIESDHIRVVEEGKEKKLLDSDLFAAYNNSTMKVNNFL